MNLALVTFLHPIRQREAVSGHAVVKNGRGGYVIVLSIFLRLFRGTFCALVGEVGKDMMIVYYLAANVGLLLVLVQYEVVV